LSEASLRATNLAKSYRGRRVVNDVSLALASGEVVGLLGPNGAGKTTSFYMVVGLVACDRGRILLNNRDITGLPMHRRARLGVGYLPQEPSVFRKLSVYENVLAVLENRADLNRAKRPDTAEGLLHELHIGHLRDSLGISLSGGERRRVEIARALAAAPRFMLLDEPFAGVDPISVQDIRKIVAHLAERGIGVLITDHNVREALGICERAYILNEGRVIAEGAPNALTNDPQVRKVYLGDNFRL
jgi:lipopolysaccharide export system ATP-binding protein